MPQETHTLRRDGEPDLKFHGELIGEASSHSHQGPKQNRWEEVHVYRTTGGRYLLVEGEGGDVVDLVKRALEEGGVDAAEELEGDNSASTAALETEAREDGAILYVVAVIHEGDVTPHVSAGTDPGDLLDELRDLGEKPAIVESLRRVLSAHVDPDVWQQTRKDDADVLEDHELDEGEEGGAL